MGCGSSKITVVKPVDLNGCEDATGAFPRGDSAISKHTTDSGVGLETEGATPSRRVVQPLSPRKVLSPAQEATPRQTSSDIMEQLRNQGIIMAPPTVGGAGEAYSLMMDSTDRVLQKPPTRLQSLQTSREQTGANMETIEAKMRSVEERRKGKEAELKQRLRSARLRANTKLNEEEDEGGVPGLEGPELETDSSFLQTAHPLEDF